MPSAQQMQVKMIHRLPSIFASIDDDAVAAFQLLASRQAGSGSQQMTKQRRMFSRRLRLRGDVLFGNNQQMSWSLRIDIRKGYAEFVFVHTVRGDLSIDDFAE